MAFSYQNYTGNNATTTFSIPFTYTDTSEISVTVDGVAETGLAFPSSSEVTLTSAPASGTLVQVRRTTSLTARAVDFASGSVLTEEDLDNSSIQTFHASQEANDRANDAIAFDADGKWDAQNKVIKNLATPTDANDATNKSYVDTSANNAASSAAAALVSQNASAASATASANSATASAGSATTSANEATDSANSATASAASASTATTQAALATTNGAAQVALATSQADNAASSATTAATQAGIATTQAGIATTKAGEASTSASNAATSETNASTSATNAATSAANSANSETASATSESNASTSETNSATSETNALASKTAAANSASAAATSESNSATSASASATSASQSASSASAASTSETNSATSATNSANSASAASTSASNAASSASSASSAQTAAESARDATLAAYDNFDDRYLGAKSSSPTVDNDGNALIAGSLFFDTTNEAMKIYTGSAWVAAYVTGADFIPTSGGGITGDLAFGDNNKAIFGAGNDLQVYHNGNDSVVRDAGTGDLLLAGSTNVKITTSGFGETMAEFATNGAATLYYNNLPKLATTASGIDVTGTVTAQLLDLGTNNPRIRFDDSDTSNNGEVTLDNTSLRIEADEDNAVADSKISLRVDGSEQAFINSSGLDVTGSVTADGLTVDGTAYVTTLAGASDTNTFIRFEGSDVIALRTGNSERMRISSIGNVGIGTTATTGAKLKVDGGATAGTVIQAGNAQGGVILGAESSTAYVNTTSSTPLAFEINNSEHMRVDSGGKLNVNNTTGSARVNISADNWPENALALYSAGIAGQTNFAGMGFFNQDADSPIAQVADIYTNPTGTLSLTASGNPAIQLKYGSHGISGGTPALTVDNAGKVGIGTTSPDFKAEIVGGTNNGLHIKDAESATVFGGLFTQSANLALVARSNHALTLGTNDTERLRIDSSGNLLHQRTSNTISGTSVNKMTLGNGTGQYGAIIDVGSGSGYYGFAKNGAYNSRIRYDYTSDSMAFDVNNSEAMHIDSSGSITVKGEGSATTSVQQGLAKAWINYNGDATGTIRDSFNCGSVTDNGTGNHTVNYTNNMANTGYAVMTQSQSGDGANPAVAVPDTQSTNATGSTLVSTWEDGGGSFDSEYTGLTTHGDLA